MAIYPALRRVLEAAIPLKDALEVFTEHHLDNTPWPSLSAAKPGRECFAREEEGFRRAMSDERITGLLCNDSWFGVIPLVDCLCDLGGIMFCFCEAADKDALAPVFEAETWLTGRPGYSTITPDECLQSCLDDLAKDVFGHWGACFFKELYGRKSADQLEADKAFEPWKWYTPESAATDLFSDEELPLASLQTVSGACLSQFVPNAEQKAILAALDGRALKKAPLAEIVYGRMDHGNRLYRDHSLKELRRMGLVEHKRGLGFYRPDRPPPGMSGLY